MQILQNNRSPVSRLKYFTLKSARPWLGLFNGHKRPWSDWNPELVPLPDDSERAIEVPWVGHAIQHSFGLWLDVGFAHAEDRYWQAIYRSRKRLLRYGYGLDITMPSVPNPLPMFVQADLIADSLDSLPRFDVITCISTLEHVGCDNKMYNPKFGAIANPSQTQLDCLQKMLRQLTARGHLLLSLPYGKYQDNQWFLQYDAKMVDAIKRVALLAGKAVIYEGYYRLVDGQGWANSKPEQMKDILYRGDEKRAAGVVLLEFA